MILLLHIMIALASVLYTSYLYMAPQASRFYTAYGLVGATIASGTYLVLSTHSALLRSCVTGLAYLAVVSTGIIAAQYRYQRQKNS